MVGDSPEKRVDGEVARWPEMGKTALGLCSGARAKLSASEGAPKRGEAKELGGGGRDSPEEAAGAGEDGGADLAGAGVDGFDDRGVGSETKARTSFAVMQAELMAVAARRMRGRRRR